VELPAPGRPERPRGGIIARVSSGADCCVAKCFGNMRRGAPPPRVLRLESSPSRPQRSDGLQSKIVVPSRMICSPTILLSQVVIIQHPIRVCVKCRCNPTRRRGIARNFYPRSGFFNGFTLQQAQASGTLGEMEALVERCMADYDLIVSQLPLRARIWRPDVHPQVPGRSGQPAGLPQPRPLRRWPPITTAPRGRALRSPDL
jgi:hypothetical protein